MTQRHDIVAHLLRRAQAQGLLLAARDGLDWRGHDADLLAQDLPWPVWEAFLVRELAAHGWTLGMTVRRGHLLMAFARRQGDADPESCLQLDLHRFLTARTIPIADLGPILRQAPVIDGIRTLPEDLGRALRRREQNLCHGPWTESAISLVAAAIRHPRPWGRVLWAKLIDGWTAWRHPPAPLLAFSGPDGAGKSAIIAELARLLPRRVCRDVHVLHTRPFLLGKAGAAPMGEPVCHTPRRTGPIRSLLRLVLAAFDYRVGDILCLHPLRARGVIILADRWALDYLIDPHRRGISLSDSWLRVLERCAPAPHRQIIILASPAVLVARKGELSLPEAERQVAAYRRWGEARGALILETDDLTAPQAALRIVSALTGSERPPCGC